MEMPKQPNTSPSGEKVQTTSDTVMPFRKGKSAAEEDENRKKSMKNDEEERVFVGEKEDNAPVEPVSIPTKLRLSTPDDK
jgi:hypothetical protein